jgi:threonylcarbamoyladenosine tRNA methylthiotransferase MtaB
MASVRVLLTNLGCKLNQAEVDAMARQFVARGHRLAASLDDADLHVVNSCTVTHQAARDSRKAARRAGRERRAVRTVLTGCYATAEAAEAAALAGVDLVVPNRDKHRLVELVAREFPEWAADALVRESPLPLELATARALVKIEDGCGMPCAFCVIPRTRGVERSRPLREVAAEVAALEQAGHREIVVTGVLISSYRDGAARLPELLDAALAATRHCRFRLSSIAPWDVSSRLVERLAHPRVCRHLHLALQSGDDRVLRRMRRPYTAAAFAATVDGIRRRVPGVAVTTDVIVGFPGESEAEFATSLRLIEELGFARVHTFTYSARPGTAAAAAPDPVPPERKRERMGRVLEVAARTETAFRRANLGSRARVLWEVASADGWVGTTDNYLRAFAAGGHALRGRLTGATLDRLVPGGVAATLTEPG